MYIHRSLWHVIGAYVNGKNEPILLIKLYKFHTRVQYTVYICDGTIYEICHYLLHLSPIYNIIHVSYSKCYMNAHFRMTGDWFHIGTISLLEQKKDKLVRYPCLKTELLKVAPCPM
jgi:hypothetical protein